MCAEKEGRREQRGKFRRRREIGSCHTDGAGKAVESPSRLPSLENVVSSPVMIKAAPASFPATDVSRSPSPFLPRHKFLNFSPEGLFSPQHLFSTPFFPGSHPQDRGKKGKEKSCSFLPRGGSWGAIGRDGGKKWAVLFFGTFVRGRESCDAFSATGFIPR